MNIEDYKFSSRQLGQNAFESTITNKDNVSFSCSYRANAPAPNDIIFNEFLKNGRNFTINVESEIIKDEPVIEIKPIIELPSELNQIIENKVLTNE